MYFNEELEIDFLLLNFIGTLNLVCIKTSYSNATSRLGKHWRDYRKHHMIMDDEIPSIPEIMRIYQRRKLISIVWEVHACEVFLRLNRQKYIYLGLIELC